MQLKVIVHFHPSIVSTFSTVKLLIIKIVERGTDCSFYADGVFGAMMKVSFVSLFHHLSSPSPCVFRTLISYFQSEGKLGE